MIRGWGRTGHVDLSCPDRYTLPMPTQPSILSGAVRRLAIAIGIIGALVLSAGPALAQTPSTGTPVLGTSLLSAQQIADWYASTGVTSRSPTPVATLAQSFIDEGAAQGVRGDIAFAQSMLETGYLRYGGQVRPSDLNFSGLGACDSCARGLAFASATLGVRAQIQHLWAYASPTAAVEGLARPLADIRFDLVQPKGRTPLWEMMGGGNWASDPDYAPKVLAIWHAMLDRSGVTRPAASTAPGTVRTVAISPSGGGRLGGWLLHRRGVSGAVGEFGAAGSTRPAGGVCLLRWQNQGVAVLGVGGDPCGGDAGVRWVRLTGAGWRTGAGLAVGDTVARLRSLYPRARTRGIQRWLVWGRDPGSSTIRPRLRAEIRNGRVRALVVSARTPNG